MQGECLGPLSGPERHAGCIPRATGRLAQPHALAPYTAAPYRLEPIMPEDRNARGRLSGGARRVLQLYASDTACHFGVRLALVLCLMVLMLRVGLSR